MEETEYEKTKLIIYKFLITLLLVMAGMDISTKKTPYNYIFYIGETIIAWTLFSMYEQKIKQRYEIENLLSSMKNPFPRKIQ